MNTKNAMLNRGVELGNKLFSRHVMCVKCHYYGRLVLVYQTKPWHCQVCGQTHDLSHATIEAAAIHESTAQAYTNATLWHIAAQEAA